MVLKHRFRLRDFFFFFLLNPTSGNSCPFSPTDFFFFKWLSGDDNRKERQKDIGGERGIDRDRGIKSSPGENKSQGFDNLKTTAADTRLVMRGGVTYLTLPMKECKKCVHHVI